MILTSFRLATILRVSLAARPWRGLVVDESHTLSSTPKGSDSQQTEAIAALSLSVPQ